MYIAVKLEGNKYHNLIPLISGTESNLLLATVYDNQRKGTVGFFIKDGGTTIPVDSITIADIPPARAGETDINVFCSIKRRNRLYIEISINGETKAVKTIALNKYIPGKSLKDKTLLALLLLLIAGITFISVYAIKPGKTSRNTEAVNPAESTRPAEPAETKTSAGAAQTAQTAQATNTIETTKHAEMPQPEETAQITKTQTTPEAAQLPELPLKSQIIYFTPNSPILTTKAQKKLIKLIPLLNSVKVFRTQIIGHCALFGTEKGRTELSLERAVNTFNFLKRNGWHPVTEPKVIGYAGRYPVTRDRKKQDLNRRVEITLD